MIKFIQNIFTSNLNSRQIKQTIPTLEKILQKRNEYSTQDSKVDFVQRVSDIKETLKVYVDKIPREYKESIQKVERTNGLPKEEIALQEQLFEVLPEVYAMLDKVFKDVTGNGYFDVQLQAGIILSQGQRLVEQYTGEGKTRTFILPLALYALTGRSSHLVTVNDYLAKVGGEYAGHILSKLGLSVGIITPSGSYKFIPDQEILTLKGEDAWKERQEQIIDIDKMSGINLIEVSKSKAYACDVQYATNNELGFDYLRDNMAWNFDKISQRELYFCMVDEADSILIDEARTPLIISATPSDADSEKYSRFAKAVASLDAETDYTVDYKDRNVILTEEGLDRIQNILDVENIWNDYSMAFHLENALKAKVLFNNNDQYIVKNGQVYIVDEFTGRILEGRRYSEGLHQAIEAKENVEIKPESKTFATITFQNLFRLYKVLCGGSGTVLTEAEEFYKIYGLESVVIPTNRKNIRIDNGDRVYRTTESKFRAVVADVLEQNKLGRPVLIGTASVDVSEEISKLLDKAKVKHQVLNAKFHEMEARIVSNAGKKGSVTVATNMAGRGTDIVIGGGTRGDQDWQEVADLGGLYVIGTERHDARRIDNQLRGRTGRQGEPGETRFYVSMEDKIMRVLGGDILKNLMGAITVDDNTPIEMGLISRQIESAQKRIEGVNFDSRKRLVDYDDVTNKHREIFYLRRKNILTHGEQSAGTFWENGKTVYLSTIDKKEEYLDMQEQSRERLANIIIDSVQSIVSHEISTKQLDASNIDKLILSLNKIIPTKVVEKFSNKTESELQSWFGEMISGKDINSIVDLYTKSVESHLESFGESKYNVLKLISLEILDNEWVEHLEILKGIREGVRLQSYAQKDPLVEYKNTAFIAFESFINKVLYMTVEKILKLEKKNVAPKQQIVNSTNAADIADVLEGDREFVSNSSLDINKVADKINSKMSRTQASLRTNNSEPTSKQKRQVEIKTSRNEKVNVIYTDGRELKGVKFKKVENDIKNGLAKIQS